MPLQKVIQAGVALSYGNYERAGEALAPSALQYLMAARRLGQEGATTLAGRPILTKDSEPLRLTLPEALAKSMGFQPVRLAEHQQTARIARSLEEDRRDQVQNLAGKLAQAIRNQDEEAYQDAIQEMNTYNQKMLARGRLADLITPKAVMASVKRRFQPVLPDASLQKMFLRQQRREFAEPFGESFEESFEEELPESSE
jgi:hypothetical protein